MRKIKFRVFDKAVKKMHIVGEDIHDSLTCFDGIVKYYNLQNGEGSGDDGDYVLMKYTGLHDNNGIEIYEGDIIVFGIGGFMLTKYEVKMVNGCFVVECIPDCVDDHVFGNCHLLYDIGFETRDIVEVIGNIYENPELLEEK
ncbi:YopX family protein [Heyndrickxia coagulans]|uniref:YopX family protein n=1 Tax=Heyndrickxia coagulans TaxID=1398 RepID=UPI00068939C7|nr:YopX family protein [Heyndrickxia coagulans]